MDAVIALLIAAGIVWWLLRRRKRRGAPTHRPSAADKARTRTPARFRPTDRLRPADEPAATDVHPSARRDGTRTRWARRPDALRETGQERPAVHLRRTRSERLSARWTLRRHRRGDHRVLPAKGDRVIEIAVARVDASGRIEDEYATLINPEGRDTGPVFVHGISNGAVRNAPLFADVAGDVLARLEGAVVVAHNAVFEERFLAAEPEPGGHLGRLAAGAVLALARAADVRHAEPQGSRRSRGRPASRSSTPTPRWVTSAPSGACCR